jgi:hypothetical protein
MRIAQILLLPVLLMLCGADQPDASLTTSSTSLMGLSLTASVGTRHAPGERIAVKVKLVNNGPKRLQWMHGPKFKYAVTTWNGNEVELTRAGADAFENQHPLSLDTGQQIVTQSDLGKWFNLKEPGGYVLTVSVPFFNEVDKQTWGEAKVVLPFFIGNPPFPVKPDEGGI